MPEMIVPVIVRGGCCEELRRAMNSPDLRSVHVQFARENVALTAIQYEHNNRREAHLIDVGRLGYAFQMPTLKAGEPGKKYFVPASEILAIWETN